MILDTNALSAFAEGNRHVRESVAAAAGPFLPVIVLGEYRFWLMTYRDRDVRLAWLEELSRQWTILEISTKTTRDYASIRQKLRERATPIPANDTWIAALARQHGLPVLSNDTHFDVVPGIQRIPFQPLHD
jgi:predicted nucleic acid-binding protein